MKTRKRGRAFTVIELVVAVIVVLVLVAILLPAMAPSRCHGCRQIKDSTQIRGIHQGMVLWAQNNKDRYPLPSEIDAGNVTVAEDGAKDTTANIMSVLIYNGFFSPELCVSPAEANAAIKVMPDYSYSNPAKAVNPAKALWDPAFSTDFTGGKSGYFSYAHMLPADERLKNDWSNTFDATRAVIGNRGPRIASMTTGRKGRTYTPAGPSSNTYLIHGGKSTWEGNIAFNDNHIDFVTRWDPETTTYKDAGGAAWSDCLFFDEPDDAAARNNYLGNFIKAGAAKTDFTAIWD